MLLMNLTEEENFARVSLRIDAGFCKISLGLNGFKLLDISQNLPT